MKIELFCYSWLNSKFTLTKNRNKLTVVVVFGKLRFLIALR